MSKKSNLTIKENFLIALENYKKGGSPIIPFNQIINTTQTSFAIVKSLKENRWINID